MIDEDSDESVSEQLAKALRANAGRVIDLFREWDTDGDGSVSRKEFRVAMPRLGFDVPEKDIDALFNEWRVGGHSSVETPSVLPPAAGHFGVVLRRG